MTKFLLSALLLLLLSIPAHGQRLSTTTGNSLLESCEIVRCFPIATRFPDRIDSLLQIRSEKLIKLSQRDER